MKLSFLSTPKIQMFLALSVLFWSVVLHQYSTQAIVSYVTLLVVAVFAEFIFLEIREVTLFPFWAGAVSAVIIALLTIPDNLFLGIVCVIIAIATKQFLRILDKHIFNPAALGLFVGHMLFHTHVSWWAVSFQQPNSNVVLLLLFLILFLPGLVSILRLKRHRIILSFLFVSFLLSLVQHVFLGNISWMQVFFGNPTLFFFSLVMLPEPMTSPNKPRLQLLYGSVVALLFFMMSLPLFSASLQSIPDFLLLALLIGNVLFSDLVVKTISPSPQPVPSSMGE